MNPKKILENYKNMNSVVEILESLGYKFKKHGKYFTSNAVYRNGSDTNSLVYYPQNNYFVDFVNNERGTGEKLIGLTLNIPATGVNTWLKNNNYNSIIHKPIQQDPQIKMAKTYELNILSELLDDHTYFLNRDISLETLKLFKGGLATKGKMAGRYVLPIFNDNTEHIIGFIGRDTYNNIEDRPKYKIIGDKGEFKWPLFLNENIIKSKKEIILVESTSCILKMWESNINTAVCLFGTKLSIPLLNKIIALDPRKIIISLNNEPDNKNIGNEESNKLYEKLVKYFDIKQIEIFLPYKKDFGDQNIEENKKWYTDLQQKIYGNN